MLGRGWVSLTCASDRFDIDGGRVRCHCATADFAGTTDADAVVVVPVARRGRGRGHASPMIAHAAAPVGRRGVVEIAVRRRWARCARPYRFAYVGGRRCEVMGVSAPFAFDHRGGGPCDCDCGGAGAHDDDDDVAAVVGGPDRPAAARDTRAFVATLMDTTRLGGPRCPACNVPANHRQVSRLLTTSADRLRRVASDVHGECAKLNDRLNKCSSLLEHQQIKTNILNAEMKDSLRFVDDLISGLLENRRAIVQTGDEKIFLRIDKTNEIEMSANQRFMHSIAYSQCQIIDNLTAMFKELLIMINTRQLFS